MKKIGWIAIIVIVGIIIFRVVQKFRKVEEKVEIEVPMEVVIENVKKGDIAQILEYTGNIAGQEQVQVYPIEETGRLIKYLVKEGNRVSKGDVIALVDRSIKGMEFQSAKITSPISGTVAMLFLDKGAMVAPQISIAMIANMDRVKVEIQIVEKELTRIKKGQFARAKVDAYPDKTFTGRLTELSPAINPLSKTAKGEIIINNPHHLLKPGMFARVELIVDKHKDILVISNKAVLKREDKEIVFTDVGGIAKQKEVKTGFKDKNYTEIISGLELGESVIVLGNYGLRNGAKIRVKSRE